MHLCIKPTLLFLCLPFMTIAQTVQDDPVYDHLVWSDEFDIDGAIDNTKWFHQTKLPNGSSWYNGEQQHYTNRTVNSFVDEGFLNIVAKKESFTDQNVTKQYTSARLNSKFAFTYGKVEVRAKLPTGVGTWPAIWALGKNINENGGYWDNEGYGTTGWPACGEIDIMEHWGTNQNYVQSAMHTPSSYGGTVNLGGQHVSTASTQFHVYTMYWTPERIIFSVDDVVHYTYDPSMQDDSTWPFDAEQYLLLNVAIQQSIVPSFTQDTMEIDYVRVYQESPLSTSGIYEDLIQVYYPNPVDDKLNIAVENAEAQNVPLKIYNMNGKLVRTYTKAVTNNIILLNNLDELSSGIYLVVYTLENSVRSLKFVKR